MLEIFARSNRDEGATTPEMLKFESVRFIKVNREVRYMCVGVRIKNARGDPS